MNPQRVLIVEDHEMVREMIVGIVQEELGHQVVAQTPSVAEGIALCLQHKPDLVILDWTLPDGRGFQIVREAGPRLPHTRWLCLSANEQEHLVSEAVNLGLQGFVLKRSSTQVLGEAIATVLRGESYYCPAASKLLVEALRNRRNKLASSLTPRERDVLQAIARGENTKEIASRLGLEQKTVHNHLASLKDKLGIREPAGLVRWAIRHGLVEAP